MKLQSAVDLQFSNTTAPTFLEQEENSRLEYGSLSARFLRKSVNFRFCSHFVSSPSRTAYSVTTVFVFYPVAKALGLLGVNGMPKGWQLIIRGTKYRDRMSVSYVGMVQRVYPQSSLGKRSGRTYILSCRSVRGSAWSPDR